MGSLKQRKKRQSCVSRVFVILSRFYHSEFYFKVKEVTRKVEDIKVEFNLYLVGYHLFNETNRMMTRFPFVRVRRQAPRVKRKYENKSVLLSSDYDFVCDKMNG